jgi:putative DNA-invertase from lambdoid prophage Rac
MPLRKTTESCSKKPWAGTDEIVRKMKPQNETDLLKRDLVAKKVLIYARVSTADQQVENQIRQLKDYAAAQRWQVVDVVVDVCSGGKEASGRIGLSRVLTLAHQRRFDILLFWSLDRFSREGSRQTIAYLTQLEKFGVDWHSFTEPYISSLGVFADAIISILSALAKQERVRISERTKAGLARARADGKKLGRPKTSGPKIAEAQKLRKSGLTFREIGERLGVTPVRAFQLCNGCPPAGTSAMRIGFSQGRS